MGEGLNLRCVWWCIDPPLKNAYTNESHLLVQTVLSYLKEEKLYTFGVFHASHSKNKLSLFLYQNQRKKLGTSEKRSMCRE